MYEKENGPKRLARALHDTENRHLKGLAYVLRYATVEQLEQDIEALFNHFFKQEEN